MAYASSSDVAILCQNILAGASNFSTSTSPTLAAVNRWLSSGCGVIETMLNGKGYSTPVASGTAAAEHLVDCNALFAAARVELSRTNVTLGPGERTRGQVFQEYFEDCMESFFQSDLTLAGVSRQGSGVLYTGGISISDKQSREEDTDRVKPRFNRGQFDTPGTITPNTTTAS